MDAASIDKLEIIDNSFIQSDCKAPFLTSNTADNLPVVLATHSEFKAKYIPTSSSAPSRNAYYKTTGEKENPKFTSNNTPANPATWPTNGWQISASHSNNDAYKVFDTDPTPATTWSSPPNTYNDDGSPVSGRTKPFITIKYPSPVLIKSFKITTDTYVSAPTKINIYGCRKIRGNRIVCGNTPIITLTSPNGVWSANPISIETTNLYDGFKIEFAQKIGNTTKNVSIKGIQITTRSPVNAWSVYKPATWPNTQISQLNDINFTPALPPVASGNLLELLNQLRICYNLLDDLTKFSGYKAQTADLRVGKYSMTGTTPGTYAPPADLAEINTAMDKIFSTNAYLKLHQDKTSFYAVKRLLKAYEYIIHVYIAMTLEDPNNSPTHVTDAIIIQLTAENNSASDKNYGYNSMQQKLDQTTKKYDTHLGTIDNLDVQLEDLKEDVVKEKSIKATNSNILNKNTVVYYVFLLLFIILAGVLLYALQKQEDAKSKLYVGGVLVTSIVAIILIYFLNMTYLKEGFTTSTVTTGSLNDQIVTYLTDTMNIALLNINDRTYKSVIHVVNKEIDRYDGINTQLKLEAAGTNDVQVDDYRNARVLQYRVYLLLQIMIILSIAMFIYLYTGENVLLFGIVLLLILFVIYLYILNSHGLVHTDAKKIYWGEPSII